MYFWRLQVCTNIVVAVFSKDLLHWPLQEGFKEGQYWDTALPYHYIRTQDHPEGTILIVGGEDHHTGIKPDEYEVLHSSCLAATV